MILLSGAFPWLSKLIGMKFVPDNVCDFFKSVVISALNNHDSNAIIRPDMKKYLDTKKCSNNNNKLDIDTVLAIFFYFFVGGFDVVSNGLCLVCHELAVNPDIQDKLRTEIDEVLLNSG